MTRLILKPAPWLEKNICVSRCPFHEATCPATSLDRWCTHVTFQFQFQALSSTAQSLGVDGFWGDTRAWAPEKEWKLRTKSPFDRVSIGSGSSWHMNRTISYTEVYFLSPPSSLTKHKTTRSMWSHKLRSFRLQSFDATVVELEPSQAQPNGF